jgi:tRNA nucleotidyltransferase/poly(A) polymerase
VDIAVEKGSAMAAGKKFADLTGGALVILGKERLARVHVGDAVADFTPLRAKNLEADLRLRDFTVNSMAVRLPFGKFAEIIDPNNGLRDFRSKLVRVCGPGCFRDDPVRLWRAIRFAARLSFRIEGGTRRRIKAESGLAKKCTAERLRDELFRLLSLPKAAPALREALSSGVLLATFPEMKPMLRVPAHDSGTIDVMEHTLEAMEHLDRALARPSGVFSREAGEAGRHLAEELVKGRSRTALLRLALLLHDISKPETVSHEPGGVVHFYEHERKGAEKAGEVMRKRLRMGGDEVDAVTRIIRLHLRMGHLASAGEFTDRAVYRFLKASGGEFFEVLLHAHADRLATHHRKAAPFRLLARTVSRVLAARRQMASRVPRERFLDGNDVMKELGIKPGPQVGEVLRAVEEAVAVGAARNRVEALRVAREALDRSRRQVIS